jgi:hypothetical protein
MFSEHQTKIIEEFQRKAGSLDITNVDCVRMLAYLLLSTCKGPGDIITALQLFGATYKDLSIGLLDQSNRDMLAAIVPEGNA